MPQPTTIHWIIWGILVCFSGINLFKIIAERSFSGFVFWVFYSSVLVYGGVWSVISILHFLAPLHFLYLSFINTEKEVRTKLSIKDYGVFMLYLIGSYLVAVFVKQNFGLPAEGFTFFLDSVFYSQIANLLSHTGIESAYVGQLNVWFGEAALPTPYHYPEIWATKILAPLLGLSSLTFFDFWLHFIVLAILSFVFYTQSKSKTLISFIWAFTLAWITPGLFTYLQPESFPVWFNNLPGNDTRPFYFPASRVGGIKNTVLAITGVYFFKSIAEENHKKAAFWGAVSVLFSIAIAPLIGIVLGLYWLIKAKLKTLLDIALIFTPIVVGLFFLYFFSPESGLPTDKLPKNHLYFELQALNPGFLFRSVWLGASQLNSIFFWPIVLLLTFVVLFIGEFKYRTICLCILLSLISTSFFPAASLLGPIQALPWFFIGLFVYKHYGVKHLFAMALFFISLMALAYLPALLPKVIDIWQLFNLAFSFFILPVIFFLGEWLSCKLNDLRAPKVAWIICMALLFINSIWINKYAVAGTNSTHIPDGVLSRVESKALPVKTIFFAKATNPGHLYVDMQGEEILTFTNNWTTTPAAAFDDFPNGFDSNFIANSNKLSWTMPLVKFASRHQGLNREQCLNAFVKDKKIDWIYRQHQYSFNKMSFLFSPTTDSLYYAKGGYTVYFLSH